VPLWVGEWGFSGDEAAQRSEQFGTVEETLRIGSAFWVWKQACGNPRNGDDDPTAAVRPLDCPKGRPIKARAQREPLTRAYPRSAPGRITAIQSDGRRLQVDGDSTGVGLVDGAPDSCRLDLWVPGAAQPTVVDSTGVTDVRTVEVPEGSKDQAPSGGWRVIACASGAYRLTVS
jgi:hypothetical protein